MPVGISVVTVKRDHQAIAREPPRLCAAYEVSQLHTLCTIAAFFRDCSKDTRPLPSTPKKKMPMACNADVRIRLKCERRAREWQQKIRTTAGAVRPEAPALLSDGGGHLRWARSVRAELEQLPASSGWPLGWRSRRPPPPSPAESGQKYRPAPARPQSLARRRRLRRIQVPTQRKEKTASLASVSPGALQLPGISHGDFPADQTFPAGFRSQTVG